MILDIPENADIICEPVRNLFLKGNSFKFFNFKFHVLEFKQQHVLQYNFNQPHSVIFVFYSEFSNQFCWQQNHFGYQRRKLISNSKKL